MILLSKSGNPVAGGNQSQASLNLNTTALTLHFFIRSWPVATLARPNAANGNGGTLLRRGTTVSARLVALLLLGCALRQGFGQSWIDRFDPNVNGAVKAVAVQDDGRIVIGGEFTSVNGTNRNHLARLNADGSLDAAFDPGAGDKVLSLTVQPDGKILVGGGFTTLGGTNRSYIGRLNADGSLDTGFNPGANDWVWSLALATNHPQAEILIGGAFTILGGTNHSYIGRLKSDGTPDSSFSLGADDQVNNLIVQADGRVLLGGFFSMVGGVSRRHVARLNSDGSLDPGFNPGAGNTVWNLALEPYNTILMVGDFTTVAGTNRTRIARLYLNGELDANFNPAANGTVNSLVVQKDGRILVGGNFTSLAGTNASYLGRLNMDGSLDASFNLSTDSTLYSLAMDRDGRIIVGGSYTMFGGLSRNRLARLGLQSNDNFAAASVITGEKSTVFGSNVGTSKEGGEPDHSGRPGGSSIWWKWMAPMDCLVTLGISSSFPDVLAGVYTGDVISNLNPIASSAATVTSPSGGGTIFLMFNAVGGTVYRMAVDGSGYSSSVESGDIILRLNTQPVVQPPPNDNFATAIGISGLSNSVSGSNVGAAVEAGEPIPYVRYVPVGASVWWFWSAPTNAVVTIDTIGSSFDTALAVYTGDSVSNLTNVARNDDAGGLISRVTFCAVSGTNYRVAVYGVNASSGNVVLNLRPTPDLPNTLPPNDNFTNSVVVSGVSNRLSASNLGATLEPGEHPSAPDASGATVWWSFIAPSDGLLELDGVDSSIPLVLSVYQGSSASDLTNIISNYRASVGGSLSEYLLSRVKLEVQAGQTYYISADGLRGAEGTFNLGIYFSAAPPNNDFASRISINTATATVTGSNLGADLEPGEPTAGANSVWWAWTPTQSQSVVFTTFGSTFDTVLSVYTNSALMNLALVISNNDAFAFGGHADPSSRIRLDAVANTAYQIAICGATQGEAGEVHLDFVTLAIEEILATQRIVQADRSVDFSVDLRISNLRPNATGPLRIRLVARAGYSCLEYLKADLNFLDSLKAPDEGLDTVNLPAPGNVGAASSIKTTVKGHCPPPYEAGKWGFGRGIIAILEEQVGGTWKVQDGRVILFGEWPVIGGANGPAGGVITITSGLGSTATNPRELSVLFGPPSAIRLGGMWRISPTNYGEVGELFYYTDFMTSSRLLEVQSTNFTIEVKELAGFVTPGNRTVNFGTNQAVLLDLSYQVVPPRLTFNALTGLGMAGTPGTTYRIEFTPQLAAPNTWSAQSVATLSSDTNWIPNTAPGSPVARYYRAVWLPE